MSKKLSAGLLPLYLKLYDESNPTLRDGFATLLQTINSGFAAIEIDVVQAPICCVKSEFEAAVAEFEKADVDCIVTVHLAYSPSLESVEALAGTALPLLILDTTMDHAFGIDVDPKRISYNHGIHGVMDLANMLRRTDKHFEIVAGHISESDIFDRAAACIRGASAARALASTRALRIGESFKGMGDFTVDAAVMKSVLGITVEQVTPEAISERSVSNDEVRIEMLDDNERYDVDCPEDTHARTTEACLKLRSFLDKGGYDAFSMNFLAFDEPDGPVVPFLEASKAMARGIGYAGEGDLLTAALVGALQQAFGTTTFTEIFCPDWKGDTLFISHMGEINPEIAASTPALIEKDFPYTSAANPAAVTCSPRPGPAVFVNLAPGPDDTFTLIIATVEVMDPGVNDKLKKAVHGWIKPQLPVATFLEQYSEAGGTHHSALVLDGDIDALTAFAAYAGMDCFIIG